MRSWMGVLAVACAAVACHASDRSVSSGDGDFTNTTPGGAPCTDGDFAACAIELGRHDGVIDCAQGTKTCVGGSWGTCQPNGSKKTVAAPPAKMGWSDDIGTQSVGGTSTTCVDDPCNPYCNTFTDTPGVAVTSTPTTTTTTGSTVSLSNSNTPSGFQKKGTLDAQCATPCTSYACMSACQFDMHCGTTSSGTAGCVAYGSGEEDNFSSSWACSGQPDITMPPVCSTDSNTTRNLTICNRGTADLTQNVRCYGYPGNSPMFPNDSPGVGNLVLDTSSTPAPTSALPISTSTPIKAGTCRTYKIANSQFTSSGTESIMCNPQSTGSGTVTTTITSLATTSSGSDWAPLANVLSDTDANATTSATVGQSVSRALATSSGDMSPSGSWANVSNVYSLSDGGASMSAPFASTVGTTYSTPTTTLSNVGTGGITPPKWALGYASPKTSAPADFKTALAAIGDGYFAAAALPKPSNTTLTLAMPIAAPPAGSVLQGLHVHAVYTLPTSKIFAKFVLTKADGTVVWTACSGSGTGCPASAALGLGAGNVLDADILPPLAITAADLPNMQLQLYASSSTGSSTYSFSVDAIGFTTRSYVPSTSTVSLSAFAFSIPSTSTITAAEIEVAWNTSIANSNATMGLQAVDASGTAIGSEQTASPPPSSLTTSIYALPSTGLTPASFGSGFKVRVRATRGSAGVDPDFQALVDYIRVRVYYSTGLPPGALVLGNFGFALPSTATNISVSSFAYWKSNVISSGDLFQIQPYSGTSTIGSGTTASATSTSFVTTTTAAATTKSGGTTLSSSDLADGTFNVALGIGQTSAATGSYTASVDYVKTSVTYQAPALPPAVPECNPSNNWTVSKANPVVSCDPVTTTTYPPWTVTRVFQASCPFGTKARWKYFGWDTTAPTGTSVDFRFRSFDAGTSGTCGSLTPVTSGTTPAPLVTAHPATSTSPDTQDCDVAAPVAPFCPADLTTYLGGDPNDRRDCLQMDAVGNPSASPAASPELVSWRVTYDCAPSE